MKKICKTSIIFIFIVYSLTAQNNDFQKQSDIYNQASANIENFRKTNFEIQIIGLSKKALNDIELEVQQTSHDFLFGCIIFDLVNHGRMPENEAAFKAAFQKLFNFAVFPFYWAGYETKPGETKQQQIMEVVQWCKQNGITTKGHPLVWTHEAGTPRWLNAISTDESKVLLEKRVEKIVSEFKGEIDIWDVINEVIHTVNWDVAMKENRNGADNRYTGRDLMSDRVDFIDSCFHWANKANPDAHLIINEFNIVANEVDRQRFYDVVKSLLDRESPVHGLGIQAHEPNQGRYYYSPEQIWATFQKYDTFGLPLHLTELIQVANGDSIKGSYKTGTWTEEQQAEFAEMLYTLAFGFPSVASINWWGFSDANIWQPKGGLVDENLRPKPVYETLDRLINREWKTNVGELKPDRNGIVSFRGFKGDYLVKIKRKGEVIKSVPLKYSNGENSITIDI